MSRPLRLLFAVFIAALVVSHASAARAQWGYGGYRRGFGYGGLSYPGAQFGYRPGYLASRAFTAGGLAGSMTYGTPQPPPPEPAPRTTYLARATAATESCDDKDINGELAFRRGDYVEAIENWKQALAADPHNPVLVMLLGQAYFAAGSYRGAALTTQAAMRALPPDRWGVVVTNRNELYNDPGAYLAQLQELKTAVRDNPDDLSQRFLLAFQYTYLGYPQAALVQLDPVLERTPADELAQLLRSEVAARVPPAGAPIITPGAVTPPRQR